MSFLKFWGKKGKNEEDLKKEEAAIDQDAEKRKLRHSLSISRSGRFKQKNRERGQILDKPELFSRMEPDPRQNENQPRGASHPSHHGSAHSGRPAHGSSSHSHPRSPHTHQRSPNNTCREINTGMATGNRPMRMGQSVVT